MLVLTGSLAYDFILNFNGKFTDHILPDKIHTINLSFLAQKLSKEKGGVAGNVAYNLSLLGFKPTIFGSLGIKDGKEYFKYLKKLKINTDFIKVIKNEFTANYIVVTDLLNNQIGSFYPGANSADKDRSLKEVLKNNSLSKAKGLNNNLVVISPGDPIAMKKFIVECQKNNYPYVFDPSKQLPNLDNQVIELGIKDCSILVSNDYELSLLENRVGFNKKIFLQGNKILIVTLGGEGSRIETKDKVYKIKAAKVLKVLDPVGAGDAYLGGFLAGFIKGFDLQTCGQMGSITSVYTVEKYGTQTHKFSKKEFIKRYKDNYGKTIKF